MDINSVKYLSEHLIHVDSVLLRFIYCVKQFRELVIFCFLDLQLRCFCANRCVVQVGEIYTFVYLLKDCLNWVNPQLITQ